MDTAAFDSELYVEDRTMGMPKVKFRVLTGKFLTIQDHHSKLPFV